MDREYDIFEILPDGSRLWREAIAGHENAVRRLTIIAAKTTNEVLVMHLPTKAVIAVMNQSQVTPQKDKS